MYIEIYIINVRIPHKSSKNCFKKVSEMSFVSLKSLSSRHPEFNYGIFGIYLIVIKRVCLRDTVTYPELYFLELLHQS